MSAIAAPLLQTFGASADTFINSAHPDNNNGASTTFFTGESGEGGVMRGLLRFDMPAGLQGRASVTNATLTLTMAGLGSSGTTPGTAATETLRAVTEGWVEGTGAGSTSTTFTVGQACSGAGATWNQRNCSSSSWSTAGGTVAGTASATANYAGTIGGSCTFDSSANAAMLLDVQGWIDSPGSNFGWRITSSTEGTAGLAQRFYSKESGVGSSPSLSVTYACKSGFESVGNNCTTCTTAALAACVTSQGNGCNDSGAPSTTYTCSCSNPAYVNDVGNQACVNKNDCASNHCVDGGDSAASCTDQVAPASGYACVCSAGFSFDGTTCVLACGNGSDPCGAGGTCIAGASNWTCDCMAGWVTSGGGLPTCVQLDACTPAAMADCAVSSSGNSCIDEAPPSPDYHCGCGNPAYVAGTGGDAKPACVDLNACATNHCIDGGDSAAICTDHAAPAVGYDCTCDADYVSIGGVTPTCVLVPAPDAGSAESDAGSETADSGTKSGGMMTKDAGTTAKGGTGGSKGSTGGTGGSGTRVDAGGASPDAGSGSSKGTGGTPSADAGAPSSEQQDGGTHGGTKSAGGCGCRIQGGTGRGTSGFILMLVGLGIAVRRRRRSALASVVL